MNVSSHQAQRPVRGALPYPTAKAAIEGLTRAVAVGHGPQGVRCNAVVLGSITTERYEEFLTADPSRAAEVETQLARLHPVGGSDSLPRSRTSRVPALCRGGFVNGAVLPVDGGRAARPEER